MTRTCAVEGCGERISKNGLCNAHYLRWRRHGDPLGGGTPRGRTLGSPGRFFHLVVMQYEGNECLRWPYNTDENGYGRMGGKLVHRRVCREAHGKPPSAEHEALHGCGNGSLACVTKRHLRWGTHAENMAEMVLHGTSPRGARQGQVKLTNEQVLQIFQAKGVVSQRRLAEEHGVHHRTVEDIHKGVIWGWLTGGAG